MGEDSIRSGHAALARGDWEDARVRFERALAHDESPEALEGLSWAVWWLHDAARMFETRERAYRLYRSNDDRLGAARMATWLGTDHVDFRGELAVAQGWLGRARRLLEGLELAPEHRWLLVHEAEKHLHANDTLRARELGEQATELGRRLGLVELEMMGLATEGLALVTDGEVDEGMARLDESAAAALGGEFDDFYPTGWCCCYMIYACERTRDYDRAAQWCRRLEGWSERTRIEFVTRSCRAHHAGFLIWRGSWAEAETELTESAERLAVLRPPSAAEATVRLAELRRRQGRLDEAVETFEQVDDHPLALLGLAEVCLDRDDPEGAGDRAEQYLREAPPRTGTHVVTDEAIDVIHEHSLRTPSPGPAQSFIVPWGGAVARVGEDETPLTQRDTSWVVHPFAVWEDPADDDAVIGWARDFRDDIRRFASGGTYLNFIGDEGEDRIRAAFGAEKYARLAAVKARYDPDNVFRGNQNIKPAATG